MSHSQLCAGFAKMNYRSWIRFKLFLSRKFFFFAVQKIGHDLTDFPCNNITLGAPRVGLMRGCLRSDGL